MHTSFILLALLTALSAIAALSLRRLVHCALCLALSFLGTAGLFLKLDAEFLGFAQVLVYVGAVAILIVFAILLTRGGTDPGDRRAVSAWLPGLGVAGLVTGALVFALAGSPLGTRLPPAAAPVKVRWLGQQLMTDYVLPLEVLGLLLTVALIGAVVIAAREPEPPSEAPPSRDA